MTAVTSSVDSFVLPWSTGGGCAKARQAIHADKPESDLGAACALEPRQRLEAMFRKYHAMLWRTLRRSGLTTEAAADLVQQAYLVAAERLPDIRPGCERGFLFGTAIMLLRTGRRRERRCQLEADMDARADSRRREESANRQAYARQLLDQVLGRMDLDLVSVFCLFEIEGLTTVEIAELLGVPRGTVASRLRRAREAFRAGARQLELARKGCLP